MDDCCAPKGRAALLGEADPAHDVHARMRDRRTHGAGHAIEQVTVPAQTFLMGDARGDGAWDDGETPVHAVRLSEFLIDATSVTNDDFARFAAATGYATEAETYGFSAVFHLAIAADDADLLGRPPGTPWWVGVRGADWRHPGGRHSTIEGLGDHPVVHVSWNDAVAYCEWAGRALPTEAQWEAASRGGLDGARYPWGDDLGSAEGSPDGWRVNIWQGRFPVQNGLDDGFLTTAPVRSFHPNAYGLWQTVGNVWEWCADGWSIDTYRQDAERGDVVDPTGPDAGPEASRVMRGGSFLCHDSYCNRYRNSARTSNTPDSSMANAGFRTVALPGRTA